MARLDLRVRALGALLKLASVTKITDEQIVARQGHALPRNRVVTRLFGGPVDGIDSQDTTVRSADHPVPLRVYRPQTAETLPLVLLLHGGGWVAGDLDGYDWIAGSIAEGARAVVVSVDYRLAPTHRWPTAAEDCYAALLDVVARADEWSADPTRLAVVGDSAGGNLAAVLTLMSRDRSGPAIAMQGLLYPSTDMDSHTASMEENAHAPVLTRAETQRYRDLYIPDEANRRHPYASPQRAADHHGLPPALVQVAEHDPLRDDGLRYAETLRAAGVPVRATTYVGMPHGFLSFPGICRSAPQAMAELNASLREHLAPKPAV